MKRTKPPKEVPTTIEDSTLAGIFIAKKYRVVPVPNNNARLHYAIYGDVQKGLQEIYSNEPCGTMDMLNGIKAARAMIWSFKGGTR